MHARNYGMKSGGPLLKVGVHWRSVRARRQSRRYDRVGWEMWRGVV